MKLPTRHELALMQMFRSERAAWFRWLDRITVDRWSIRW